MAAYFLYEGRVLLVDNNDDINQYRPDDNDEEEDLASNHDSTNDDTDQDDQNSNDQDDKDSDVTGQDDQDNNDSDVTGQDDNKDGQDKDNNDSNITGQGDQGSSDKDFESSDADGKKDKDDSDVTGQDDKNKNDQKDGDGNSLLGKLKGLLGKKDKGKKKKFGDFLKKAKQQQRQENPEEKAKNALRRLIQLMRRIYQLLRLYLNALKLFLLYKLYVIFQAILAWLMNILHIIVQFIVSVWTALVGVVGTVAATAMSIAVFALTVLGIAFGIAAQSEAEHEQRAQNMVNDIAELCERIKEKEDDNSTGGVGSSTVVSPSGRKPYNIKIKDEKTKDYDKAAREIVKAVGKKTGIKEEFLYGQIFSEEGTALTGNGPVQPVVSEDWNLSGMTGGYKGKTGTAHGEKDGVYSHYENWSEFAGDWASYLDKVVFKDKKPKTFQEYTSMAKKAGYMTATYDAYVATMQQGVARYHNAGGASSATGGIVDNSSELSNKDKKDKDLCDTILDMSDSHGDILKEAKKWLGAFYYSQSKRVIGDPPDRQNDSTDCSGFVWFVLKRVHAKVPNSPWNTASMESDAKGAHKYLKKISPDEAGPGDIIIANTGSGEGNNGHTAILTEKFKGYDKTKIIQMGGDSHTPQRQQHVNIKTIEWSFGYLLKGSVTFARAIGTHGGKTSDSGDDGGSSNLSGSEKDAKEWIAQHESSGSYTAQNGRYYGRYQLDRAYLHGDLSPKNQEKVADSYVKGRYGSWVEAQKFWKAHNWY